MSSGSPALEKADTAVLDEFNRNLAQQGEEIALQQQETFTSALESARRDADAINQAAPEVAEQQLLQQRKAQEDYIKRNAKHISATLHAQMQRGASSAQPDTFSRRQESGDCFSTVFEEFRVAHFSNLHPQCSVHSLPTHE